MIIDSANEAISSSITNTPAKKISKRNGADFAKFLYNLGKTDKQTKPKSTNQYKITQNKIADSKVIQQTKPLLQNNLAQKTALDSTNNIKAQNALLIDDNKEILNPKSKDELFKKILQNKPQNDSSFTANTKDLKDSKDLKNLNEPNIIRPKVNNQVKQISDKEIINVQAKDDLIESSLNPNIEEDTKQEPKVSNVQKELPLNTIKDDLIDSNLNPDENEKQEPKVSNAQKEIPLNTAKNNNTKEENNKTLIDNLLKDEAPKFSTLSDDKVKLSLKDTLKYGTFKAFDALSLLKPSDGKKLSDLIKKADELALNITKIQHKQETIKPNEVSTKLPLDFKNNDLKSKIETSKDDLKNPKITESSQNIKEQNIKDSNTQTTQNTQNADSKMPQAKNEINIKDMEKQDSNLIKNEELKPVNLKLNNKKEPKIELEAKQANNDKNVDSINVNNVKFEQTQKNIDLKETFNGFSRALKQEIINYKPPISKVTIELNPANLGSIEVSITHQGKNIQLQLNGNQNTMNLFIQNQSDLRTALSQIGYENITMSFSNGSQMGFSDSKGEWNFKHLDKRVDSIDDDIDNEIANLEITLVNNYA
ncbi:flagellar hook-length control protein FliK [Helicobacter sp. MIT 99-5507]|uniref:flagellar hook-length control protein FliK n=1 Tax=Helicobacter sp. MIT 99-5507 TaxID=152489 RepID=UPI000E1E7C24|nr:flagellar hook-length control protein FliK [Helicobacter sp. MIT 99-5507]RDU58163.1 hypothetical protein CQA42_04500 [Helicobacter sp. MIT 99-5507]